MKEVSLYVHIPFCKQKCFYCDFPSYASMEELAEDYVDALCIEIEKKAIDYWIKSIFIGGGTPSYLSENQIQKLLKCINKLNLMKDMEFTMECNPGTLDKEKLVTMIKGGVNRISVGLQAVQNSLLDKIGRIHNFKDFEENFRLARSVGFNNINVDLMYGLPNQTIDQWKETLTTVIGLEPEHISAYSLIIEEGTCFYKMWENDKLNLPSEDDEREMDLITKKTLSYFGYNQYEISNYSKSGYECSHNKVYWKCKSYLGVGVSASSFINGYRYKNIDSIKDYIKRINNNEPIDEEKIKNSIEDNMEEFMFMGLRLINGIDINEFKARFGENIQSIYGDVIEKNIKGKLLEKHDNILRLSNRGIELSNVVMSDFILNNK